MPAAQSIDQITNPSVPMYDPLAVASVPQPPAVIVTTAANGANGSVDNGGVVDQIANAASNKPAMVMSPFGVPWYAPSVATSMAITTTRILGAFVGGYHGYKRSGGKGLVATGYGLAGALLPLPTLGVAAIQGYAKPKHR